MDGHRKNCELILKRTRRIDEGLGLERGRGERWGIVRDSHSVLPAASESSISPKLRVPWTRDIVDDRDRPWLDFALAKGFVRELAHVAEATGCVDLIEPRRGWQGRAVRDQIRANRTIVTGSRSRVRRSIVPFFVHPRTPEDVHYSPLFLSRRRQPSTFSTTKRSNFRCPAPNSTGPITIQVALHHRCN